LVTILLPFEIAKTLDAGLSEEMREAKKRLDEIERKSRERLDGLSDAEKFSATTEEGGNRS